ncbi:MAG: sigma-70 family RNA polymerase sigma factor [Bacteroidota bacterium]
MTGRSDQELVDAVRQGQEAAFNEVVRRYQERVYGVVRRFMGSHDDADDVVQEVFVRAYEGFGSFRGDSSLFTWLYRIAVNQSLNALRGRNIGKFFRLEEIGDEEDRTTERPDETLERSENRSLIEQAVARLPERQKTVFLLRYYEKLSYEEISRILNTSVGGLKANYFHAVRKIERYVRKAHASS